MSYEAFAIISVALVIGSLGKAITGFGLPMIAVPVMAAFIGVENAVVVMVIPSNATNIWLMWEHRKEATILPNMPFIVAGSIAGAAIGTWLLVELDEQVLGLIMAAWIVAYLISFCFKGGIRIRPERSGVYVPVLASVAGLSQGAVGFSGPVLAPGMHALRLAPGVHVFVISAIFLSFGVTQMVALSGFGMVTFDRLVQSLFALIPVMVATPIGIWIARRINRRVFDACVVVLLAAMGLKLAWQSLAGG